MRHELTGEDGEPYTVWEAELLIPVTCRLAAFLQDVDYTAPIGANVGALAITLARTVTYTRRSNFWLEKGARKATAFQAGR